MIRELCIDDASIYYDLGVSLNTKFKRLFELSKILNSQNEVVWGYFLGDRLVGFIHISKSFEVYDIVNVIVDKEYRNRGIGTSLIDYVIDNNKSCKELILEVRSTNDAAIDFYKNNRFKIINRRNNYYGQNSALIVWL